MPPAPSAHRAAPAALRAAWAALVLVAVVGLATAGAAAAVTPSAGLLGTAAPVTGSPAPAGGPDGAPPLAGATEQVQAHEAAVAEATERLAQLSADASAALETYQTALRARDEAILAHHEQQQRWEAARAALDDSRGEMARWTSQAYRHGVASAGVAGFVAVVDAKSPDDLQQRVTVLRQIGRVEARELEGATAAESGQADATAAAEEATRAALATAAEAESAKVASDALVAQAREQLAALEGLLEQSRRAAGDAATASAAAAVSAARLRSSGAAALAGCSGSDLSGFANGLVPASALCPLPGAPGHQLRSDAAAAFVDLGASYQQAFGEPLCVTDSYRDLAAQVAVRAAKPGLAAVPGTSNHGWGVALDLCGGVQDFGSAEHAWMRLNAPLHGWFHPAWAQAAGSKPEAWHWEFAG